MPTTDPGEKHMFNNEMRRHQEKIQQLAERIATYSEYLVRDAATRPADDQWAADIERSAQEMRRRMTALESLMAVKDIVADSSEEG